MNATYYPFIQKMISVFNLSSTATLETLSTLTGDIEVSLHLGRKTPDNFTDDDHKNIKHLNAWLRQF